jgi:hypothetical protein
MVFLKYSDRTLKIAGAIPAMGTQFLFGQANGSDQVIQLLIPEAGQAEFVNYFCNHGLMFIRAVNGIFSHVCIFRAFNFIDGFSACQVKR